MTESRNKLNVNLRQGANDFLFPSPFPWCSSDCDGTDFVPLHHFRAPGLVSNREVF